MTDGVRLFLGARVSMDTVRALSELVAELRGDASADGVRWVPPANYHVTLKFLGWSRREVVDALRDRVGAALGGARAFSFATAGLGAYPSERRPRVVWAGVEGDGGKLGELAARLEAACGELGFSPEGRAYHPHVTLGRLRAPADLSALCQSRSGQVFSKTWVDSVVLFETVKKSGPSEYVPVASWALEEASKGRRRQTAGVERGRRDGKPSTDEPPDET